MPRPAAPTSAPRRGIVGAKAAVTELADRRRRILGTVKLEIDGNANQGILAVQELIDNWKPGVRGPHAIKLDRRAPADATSAHIPTSVGLGAPDLGNAETFRTTSRRSSTAPSRPRRSRPAGKRHQGRDPDQQRRRRRGWPTRPRPPPTSCRLADFRSWAEEAEPGSTDLYIRRLQRLKSRRAEGLHRAHAIGQDGNGTIMRRVRPGLGRRHRPGRRRQLAVGQLPARIGR